MTKPIRKLLVFRLAAAAAILVVAWPAARAEGQCPEGRVCRILPPQAPEYPAQTAVRPLAPVPHGAVVRIVNDRTGGRRSYGSGTLVEKDDQQGIVLTCAHLFGRAGGIGNVSVTFPDGRRFGAELLVVDHPWDLAVLRIARPQAIPVAIADDYPRPGEPLWSCGYGPNGRYWCNHGSALGYAIAGNTHSRETLELSGTARDGDSGGPVFNSRGQLVAVLWGTDGRTVGGTYCGRIRKFLAGILKPSRTPPRQPAPIVPPKSPASPIAGPQAPPAPGDHLDRLRGRLDGLAGNLQDVDQRLDQDRAALGKRLEKIEEAVASFDPKTLDGLVRALQGRVEKAEAVVGSENLRPLVREMATGVLAERLPGAAQRMLPVMLAALGWTGPPSIAAILAIHLATGVLRRRVKRKRPARLAPTPAADPQPARQTPPSETPPQSNVLDDQYAEQLARVYALSGRSPIADATLGREYDEELRRAEQSSDGAMARWARTLRRRVAGKFYRIHSQSPTPAEPIAGDD